jgi:ORF6N domain
MRDDNNQAVRRHIDRFPPDFMFQLTAHEIEDWKSQIVIFNRERMGVRKPLQVGPGNNVRHWGRVGAASEAHALCDEARVAN